MAQKAAGAEKKGNGNGEKPRPAHEVRLGRIKCVIWANETQNGTRLSFRLQRIYRDDKTGEWHQTDYLNRDDLPIAQEVLRQAFLWAFESKQQKGGEEETPI